MGKRRGNRLSKFAKAWFAPVRKRRRVSLRLTAEALEDRDLLVADAAFDLSELLSDPGLQSAYEYQSIGGVAHHVAADLSLQSQPMREFTGDFSGAVPTIAVGDPNGNPPAVLNNRVDPNVPGSPFAGVVSINFDNGTTSLICTGTLLAPTIVVTAAHCVDNIGGVNSASGVTGDGVVDFTAAQTTVVFNHNNPTNNVNGAVLAGVNQITVHPDWHGFNNVNGPEGASIHDDVAVLTLAAAAPAGVPIYPINTVVSTAFTQLVLAGYGTQGDAINGYVPGSANFFVKLSGQNVASQFSPDDEGLQTREIWEADFDGPNAATNTLNDGLTLGNDVEVTIGGGDSGGPSFLWNDANANSVINAGELTWWGTNTYTTSAAPNFGSRLGGVIGTSQLNFLDAFIANLNVPAPAVPVTTGPASSTTDTTPTFTWGGVEFAARYDLWVRRVDQNGNLIQDQIIRQQNLTALNYTPTAALPTGNYQFWVRAFNAENDNGAWSVQHNFTIVSGVPNAPTVTGPASTVSDTTPTFTWTAQANAAKYDLWVRHIDQNGATIQDQIIRQQTLTTTSFTPTTALPAGNFRVWVRALNSAGQASAWSSAYDFTILSGVPNAPAVTGPASTVSDTTPTFTWTSEANAAKYDLWVRHIDQNGATIQDQIIRQQTLTTTSFTPTTALPAGKFRVWVRALNSAGQASAWSSQYDFTILSAPNAPTVTGPASTVTDTTPTFTWTAETNAVRYDLWVRRIDQNGATIQDQIIREQNLSTNSYTPLTALPLGKYRVWVQAFNSADQGSAWSSFYDFTII